MTRRREPVSIVTVWNNEAVRQDCLDRSYANLLDSAPGSEYVPVDNRGQVHSTAGAALNQGARAASRDYVAFVQQDIHLHSLVALEEAAGLLADDPRVGLLGAVGITSEGRLLGRIRDRVVLIGDPLEGAAEVDSLDEVLFVARRSDLLAEPLSEDPDLAWHAYAAEYGLRLRSRGLRVAAVDVPITHNSLSTNLARLDEAHAAVARMHPAQLPVRTTCGTILQAGSVTGRRLFAAHRWRLRWIRSSWAARAAKSATGSRAVVLSDLRRDISRILEVVGGETLHIHNVTPESGPAFPEGPAGTRLLRGGSPVLFTSGLMPGIAEEEDLILTNMSLHDLRGLSGMLQSSPHVIGYHGDIGYWVLVGRAAEACDGIWDSPPTRPSRLLV